jgi:hypothetical protein
MFLRIFKKLPFKRNFDSSFSAQFDAWLKAMVLALGGSYGQ